MQVYIVIDFIAVNLLLRAQIEKLLQLLYLSAYECNGAFGGEGSVFCDVVCSEDVEVREDERNFNEIGFYGIFEVFFLFF